MALQFHLDDLSDPRMAVFLEAHLADMRRISPPESVHALDLAALRQPGVRFWSAWLSHAGGLALVGTVALKRLSADHAELKSMRTAPPWRGQGVGHGLLQHALGEARRAGHARISLETGSQPFFDPAHALYAAHGFVDCPPFAGYRPDPNSRFMSRAV